ncbi:MAG: hypothetical protein NC342_02300 [Pseudoflavonifractor sp.]|nr:DNA polymerase III subunit delta [Alloprevotella sp.]MCM1116353.1 hypothetical protein [Pseudoflavonifractor sp.]
MRFSDIPGHEAVKTRLREMVDSGRLPHAILLEGPTGIGKLSLARALAQYIHCTGRRAGDTDSCGQCPACRQSTSLNHIDTFHVYPVTRLEKMDHPPVSEEFAQEWREYLGIEAPRQRLFQDIDAWTDSFGKKGATLITYASESNDLIRKLSTTSHASRYKTVVWWLPERMNPECSNKLLKMIEEPYEGTCIIMASDDPQRLLPTVYSRLQRVAVDRYTDAEVATQLEERMGIEAEAAREAARNARGSMKRAMTAVSANTWTRVMLPRFIELMRLAYQRNVGELRRWSADLASDGRDRAAAFFDYASAQVRENFMARIGGLTSQLVYLNTDEAAFARNFSRFITEANAEKLCQEFAEARRDIQGNANVKIVAFDLALKVIMLLIPPKKQT